VVSRGFFRKVTEVRIYYGTYSAVERACGESMKFKKIVFVYKYIYNSI